MDDKNALWHHQPESEVIERLATHPEQGLSEAEVSARRARFGENRISQQKPVPPWLRFLRQFHNPLIYILLVATAVTLLLAEYVDAGVIAAVVLINAIIGYVQESKAEAAINALREMLSAKATVIRGGHKLALPAVELVPGDLVLLASGDRVPADLRLIKAQDLQVDESALTGESVAAEKQVAVLAADAVLADRTNQAFAGTLVTYGQARGVVVATGDATETGKIAHMITEATIIDTPLTQKISAFSKLLLWVILGLAAITFLVGMVRGQDIVDTFMAAVALSVAAIPEGLPAVVTITLAIGVSKMAGRNAIIRKLPAVETLGSTTVICSDKTGTLTENRMTVQRLFSAGDTTEVKGNHDESGVALHRGEQPVSVADDTAVRELLLCGTLCNDSRLVEKNGQVLTEGDPTEGALLTSAGKAGFAHADAEQANPRLDSIPFESDRQYMATQHRLADGRQVIYLKGSLERVLARCQQQLQADGSLAPLDAAAVETVAHRFAAEGLRLLAFAAAYPEQGSDSLAALRDNQQDNLVFLGLQAMMDPPRAEAIDSVAACQQSGIRVKMITGDHALTAEAIARQIGIRGKQGEDGRLLAYTGAQLSAMDEATLYRVADEACVFARVAPEQKLQLVNALQQRGHVVAMTGDGVNDAPALRQADIGVAMGITGTEVAKEAADMVLTDDNFASIRAAVEEGRGVYDNLIKFITWILPTNLGQGLVIMLAVLIGATLPVLPVQALWLNMTTAVFLGLMLAFEPKEAGIMARPPRDPDTAILSREMVSRILMISLFLLVGAFWLFQWALEAGRSVEEARTLAVTLFVVVQSFYLINCRSLNLSAFQVPPLSNPWVPLGIVLMMASQLLFIYSPTMNMLFQSAPILWQDWLLILGYGLLVFLLIEGEKSLWVRSRKVIIPAPASRR